MSKFLLLSLRSNMLVLVLIMTLVPLGIIARTALIQHRQNLKEASLILERLADEVANDQEILLSGAQQLLSTVGYLPIVQQHDVAAVSTLFAELIKKSPQLTNLLMIDASGRVWASALPMPAPINASDRRFFKNALATGKFSSGEFTIGRVLSKPALSFGYPIKDRSGKIRDIATVAFTLTKYDELLKMKKMPGDSSLILVDHQGTILFSSIDPQLIGKQDSLYPQMVKGPESGTFEAMGNLGVNRLFVYKKIRVDSEQTPYLYVRAGIAKATLTHETNAALLVSVSLMLLSLGLAVGITIYISKKGILDKINSLQQATGKVAAGNLDVRVADYVIGGELGELGRSFDIMTEALVGQTKDRQLAEEATREIENIFNLFLEYSPIYIFFKDEQIRAVKLSRNYEKMLGQPLDELLGKSMHDLFPSDLAQNMIADDQRILREGVPVQTEEEFNGRVYFTLKFPIVKEGHPPMLAGFTMDVTEQKQANDEIRRLNSELEQRVLDRTTQLQDAYREQEAFSYSVSHDLRAPLRHINSFSTMLQEDFREILPDQARYFLDRIRKATNRMADLIDDLLELSRVGRAKIHYEQLPLSLLARQVTEMLQSTYPERKVTIAIADGLVAYGDQMLVRLVLENLLSNAWKYTVYQQDAKIEFGIININGSNAFFVKDNGTGFDMTYADNLFQPFQRLHGMEFEGTGIGLATVKRIIERHNGTIWAESTVGAGATFYFTLPKS